MQNISPAQLLASLPESKRQEALADLTPEAKAHLQYHWPFWARPDQLPPSDSEWAVWLVLAGRGFGKTRSGAEWIRKQVETKQASRIALIGETHKDLEEVMVYGASGLAAVFPPHQKPIITKKPIRIEFHTGALAFGYNATEPDQLRGPQFDCAWGDELAKWKYARDTWDMLQFGLRIGTRPQAMITTTPRPMPLLKEIIADPLTRVTRGSTWDNAANLSKSFIDFTVKKYEGTRLGRQELNAEILEDVPWALWTREKLDLLRTKEAPEMKRVVIAIDPSGTKGEDTANSIGIVAAGLGTDDIGYVLADRTCSLGPAGWGTRAVEAYREFDADRIVAERNFGGAMVEHVIRTVDSSVPYKDVTASRGKVQRAEPVAALYEQKRVKHVGTFDALEDQMCLFAEDGYMGDGSPDRVDALVWAITELMIEKTAPVAASRISRLG